MDASVAEHQGDPDRLVRVERPGRRPIAGHLFQVGRRPAGEVGLVQAPGLVVQHPDLGREFHQPVHAGDAAVPIQEFQFVAGVQVPRAVEGGGQFGDRQDASGDAGHPLRRGRVQFHTAPQCGLVAALGHPLQPGMDQDAEIRLGPGGFEAGADRWDLPPLQKGGWGGFEVGGQRGEISLAPPLRKGKGSCPGHFRQAFHLGPLQRVAGLVQPVAVFAALHARDEQGLARPGHGHVQQVQPFPPGLGPFPLEQAVPPRPAPFRAAVQGKMRRPVVFRRPVQGHAERGVAGAALVGLDEEDHGRFQPLGAMDGEHAHRVAAGRGRFVGAVLAGLVAELAQFVQEAGQAGIAPAGQGQGQAEEAFQVGQHAGAQMGRHGGPVAFDDVRLVEDAVQQVMHRQPADAIPPAGQQGGGANHAGRRVGGPGPVLQPPPPGAPILAPFSSSLPGQPAQVGIGEGEHRGFQAMGQGQVVQGRDQHGEQGGEVPRFQGVQQAAAPVAEVGNAGLPEGVLEHRQVGAGGVEHQDVGIAGARRAIPDQQVVHHLPNPRRHPGRLGRALVGSHPGWVEQRVAEGDVGDFAFIPRRGMRFAPSGQTGLVGDMAREAGIVLPFLEQGVHPGHHPGGAATGLVVGKAPGGEAAFQPSGRRLEQPGLGAPEAVDGLLGVAHHEHRGPRPVQAVGLQPGPQDAPLQGVGVLELVQQQVFPAAIQLHQHGGGGVLVLQQPGRLQFAVAEIQAAPLGLERLVEIQIGLAHHQAQAVQAQGALLGEPVQGSQDLFAQALVEFQVACGPLGAQAFVHLIARLAYQDGVLLGQKDGPQGFEPGLPSSSQGGSGAYHPLQSLRPLHVPLQPRRAVARHQRQVFPAVGEESRRVQQVLGHRVRLPHPQQLFQRQARRRHRIRASPSRRPPFRPPRQQAVQQLAQAGQGQFRRQFGEGRFHGPAPLPSQLLGQGVPGLLAQQRGILDDVAGRPQGQGRPGQQMEEPAMEGGDHGTGPGGEHLLQQPPRLRQGGPGLGLAQAALDQEVHRLGVRQQGQVGKPGVQALPHLRRRLAGEGDGQQLGRLRSRQQQPDHARHQQPGLAAAGAGLHHGIAGGVQGGEEGMGHGSFR